MKAKHPKLLSFALLAAGIALAQEVVTVNVPARTARGQLSGERTAYLPDGGCTFQAESAVSVAPEPMGTALCAASKVRTRQQVADAIDAGAAAR